MSVKTTLFFFLLLATLTTTAQSVDSIFARYLQFVGGEEKLRNLHTRIDSGIYDYGGIRFPFISYAASPNRYRYTVTSNGKSFAQAFDGKQGWKIDGFKNEKEKHLLKGDAAVAMQNEADVKFESPF